MTSLDMDSRRSTAVQFFVEDDNNKVSCISVTSCISEVTFWKVSVFAILVSFTKPRKMAGSVTLLTLFSIAVFHSGSEHRLFSLEVYGCLLHSRKPNPGEAP